MKIVIATGIYPPEVGGPAYYAHGLAQALSAKGHEVSVVTYGTLKKLPTGIRHLAYFLRLAPRMVGADAVIALDTFSVAVPASILCRVLHVSFIIRTGGDFLWESYVERTGDMLPLPFFYEKHQSFTSKERMIISLTKWTLSRATVVFNTEMQRNLWTRPYGIDPAKARIIGNAVDAPLPAAPPKRRNFLWHVRPTAIKNAKHVHAAFEQVQHTHPEIVLEEGTLPKEELLERMRSCYAVILPSLTELSPNYILDALRFRKPFIMDKYAGVAGWLEQYGSLVDPLDEADIARAIEELADEEGYARACARAARFNFVRTYAEIADEFLALIKSR